MNQTILLTRLGTVKLYLSLFAIFTLLSSAFSAKAATVLKIGTLAPASSVWGQALAQWSSEVNTKSAGQLSLNIIYNGGQGDEGAMATKIRNGQLDGGAFTAVGLSKLSTSILAVQMPGLCTSWSQLDTLMGRTRSQMEKDAKIAGYTIVGWSDVGVMRVYSKGCLIRTPNDLKTRKPWLWRDDAALSAFYQALGASPVSANVPEVLPNLTANSINVVIAPALACEQLQWSGKLNAVTDYPFGICVGGVVFSSSRISALPTDLQSLLVKTGAKAMTALSSKARSDDSAAYNRLKSRMTVVTLTAAEKTAWDQACDQARTRLGNGPLTPSQVARVENITGH